MKFVPGGPPRMAHQKRGLKKMVSTLGVAGLMFEPGTGKTATTLDYMSILALKSPTREARVLVIAPLAAVDTWVIQAEMYVSEQVNYWAEVLSGSLLQRGEALASRGDQPYRKTEQSRKDHAKRAAHFNRALAWGARADGRRVPLTPREGPDGLGDDKPRLIIEVLNFDTFSSRQPVGSKTMADYMMESVKRYQPDLVVVDESHKIKGASSNVSRLLGRIGEIVPRRIILTGTVMPASPMDVFGQWRFLEPYAFGQRLADGTRRRATFGNFRERFAIMGGYMGREVVGFKDLDTMQEIMALNASVATKDEALDLPQTTDVIVPVNLSVTEKRSYQEMKDDLAVRVRRDEWASVGNRLTQMMRLRQITSGYLPDDTGNVNELGNSKIKTIMSLIEDTLAAEKRIVVFCVFSHEIKALTEALEKKRDLEVMTITGGTPAEDRIEKRKRFGSDEDTRLVMVAQIKTLSLAVNELVTASHAIFGSLSQQRDDIVQARDRLNRIGQERPVTYWITVAPGTVDEVIWQSYLDRSNLEKAMLRHITERGE